jgi:hypothetical protein
MCDCPVSLVLVLVLPRYEDVVHEGRLDEDTQPEEEVAPKEDDMSIYSQASREVSSERIPQDKPVCHFMPGD